MNDEKDTKDRTLMFGIAVAIVITVMIALIASGSIKPSNIAKTLNGMNPRLLGLVVLPFLVVVFVVGNYLRKKKEERMWRDAIMKSRAKRQRRDEASEEAVTNE